VSRVYGAVVKRPLQRYNVEHRAEKLITKFEDPTAAPHRAPMYKADADLMEEVRKTEEGIHKVEDKLLDRLKTVYVSNKDDEAAPDPKQIENPERPLPRDISQHYANFVPAQMRLERAGGRVKGLARGKVTLNMAVDMVNRHQATGGQYGAQEISGDFKINKEVAANILKYFEIFKMMETTTREDESHQPDPLVAGKDWVDARGTFEGALADKQVEEMAGAKEKVERRIEEGSRKTKFIDDSERR